MNKPDDIEQWAWSRAYSVCNRIIPGAVENDVIAIVAQTLMDVKTEEQLFCASLARKVIAKQREFDAKIVDEWADACFSVSEEIYSSIAAAIRKGKKP